MQVEEDERLIGKPRKRKASIWVWLSVFLAAVLVMVGLVTTVMIMARSNDKPHHGDSREAVFLSNLHVNDGFKISFFYSPRDVDKAEVNPDLVYRDLTEGPQGMIFAGTRGGSVYAFVDKKRILLSSEFDDSCGVAYLDTRLYVVDAFGMHVFDNIDAQVDEYLDNNTYSFVHSNIKEKSGCQSCLLSLGPDDALYWHSQQDMQINRIPPPYNFEIAYAKGVREVYGIAFDSTGTMWFSDIAGDLYDSQSKTPEPDLPLEKLNRATEGGEHYGYPQCWYTSVPWDGTCTNGNHIPPVTYLGAHSSPTGIVYSMNSKLPSEYSDNLFITRSGGDSTKYPSLPGHDIVTVALRSATRVVNGTTVVIGPTATTMKTFATGWKNEDGTVAGKPFAIIQLSRGSFLISGTLIKLFIIALACSCATCILTLK